MTTRSRTWQWVQWILLVIALLFAARYVAGQWNDVSASARALHPDWRGIALASAIVLGTYAALIQSWRILVTGWGSELAFATAVRIWTIANLGKYVPGKIWSIGALGMLSQREGVSGAAAAGSSILGTLLNIGAGVGVVALFGSRARAALPEWLSNAFVAGSMLFAAGVIALPWLLPPAARWLAVRVGRPIPDATLSSSRLWVAVTINVLSWVGYGVAFMVFCRAISPAVAGALPAFIAVFTASYVAGYLALFSPGGIVVRELILIGLLVALGMAGEADAAVLAATSRLWLTVLELLPGLVSLLINPSATRQQPRQRG